MSESSSTSDGASIAPKTTSISQSSVDRIQPPAGLIEDTFDHTVDILASTFHNDPFMRYFQFDEEAGRQTELSYEYLHPVMTDIIKGFIEDEGATLVTLPGIDLTSAWFVFPPSLRLSKSFFFNKFIQVHTNGGSRGTCHQPSRSSSRASHPFVSGSQK